MIKEGVCLEKNDMRYSDGSDRVVWRMFTRERIVN